LEVVVAVDIGTWNLLEECVEAPATKTADRPVAARAGKSHWLVTVLEAYGGRLAIEATMEPPVTMGRNQEAKIPDGRRYTGGRASIGQRDGAERGTPSIDRREKKEIEKRMYRFSTGADGGRREC
jgi:hypothetical protein